MLSHARSSTIRSWPGAGGDRRGGGGKPGCCLLRRKEGPGEVAGCGAMFGALDLNHAIWQSTALQLSQNGSSRTTSSCLQVDPVKLTREEPCSICSAGVQERGKHASKQARALTWRLQLGSAASGQRAVRSAKADGAPARGPNRGGPTRTCACGLDEVALRPGHDGSAHDAWNVSRSPTSGMRKASESWGCRAPRTDPAMATAGCQRSSTSRGAGSAEASEPHRHPGSCCICSIGTPASPRSRGRTLTGFEARGCRRQLRGCDGPENLGHSLRLTSPIVPLWCPFPF